MTDNAITPPLAKSDSFWAHVRKRAHAGTKVGVIGGGLIGSVVGARSGISPQIITAISTLPGLPAIAAGNAILYDHLWNNRLRENSTSSIIPAALGAFLAPVWMRASAPSVGSAFNGLIIGTAAGGLVGFTGGALYGAAEYGIDQVTDGKASQFTHNVGQAYDATIGKSVESAKETLGKLMPNLSLPKLGSPKLTPAITQ